LKKLSGTKQRVALYRFKNEVDTSKAHVFGMKIPQIEGTELKLKEKILTELRRDVNRPLVLHLRSNAPPSIRDIVSNQARWNKVLDDGEQFPCTCAMLERVGLTRSSNGHVCCKWSEFPEDFCPVNTRRMSVLSRVMPSPARVHSELKRFVIRAVSRIGSVDVQKWLHHVEEWTDYYRELHLGYCKEGFPMETRLKQFRSVLVRKRCSREQLIKRTRTLVVHALNHIDSEQLRYIEITREDGHRCDHFFH